MASRRFSARPPSPLCSDGAADDGIDPRLTPKWPQGKVTNRKTLQQCRQVERILTGILEGDILRDLLVRSVVPAPDSSRLLVTFVFHGPATVATATNTTNYVYTRPKTSTAAATRTSTNRSMFSFRCG